MALPLKKNVGVALGAALLTATANTDEWADWTGAELTGMTLLRPLAAGMRLWNEMEAVAEAIDAEPGTIEGLFSLRSGYRTTETTHDTSRGLGNAATEGYDTRRGGRREEERNQRNESEHCEG